MAVESLEIIVSCVHPLTSPIDAIEVSRRRGLGRDVGGR